VVIVGKVSIARLLSESLYIVLDESGIAKLFSPNCINDDIYPSTLKLEFGIEDYKSITG
jgi:hypothetical protein